MRKPDSRHIICKTYIFIKSHLLSYKKLKTELKNLEHSSHTIALSKGTIFAKKCRFLAKNMVATKLRGFWYSPQPQNEPLKSPPRLGLRRDI